MPPKFSIVPVRAFEDTSLHPAALKVLVSLGAYADRRGYCYPSQATLARRLKVSRQAVNRQIRILHDLGYLKIIRRVHTSGAQLSCLYQILFEGPMEPAAKGNTENPDGSSVLVSDRHRLPENLAQIDNPGGDTQIHDATMLHGGETEATEVLPSETLCVSPAVTLRISLPEIPGVSHPEISEVAQTSQLTTQLTNQITTRENGEDNQKKKHDCSTTTEKTSLKKNQNLKNKPIHPDQVNSGEILSSKHKTGRKDTSDPSSGIFDQEHPDLQFYLSITGRYPNPWEVVSILNTLQDLRLQYPDDMSLRTYLEPIWQRWCNARRANGTPYNRSNSAWLTDWAVNTVQRSPKYQQEDMRVSCDPYLYSIARTPTPEVE